jgi:hypothetical protein
MADHMALAGHDDLSLDSKVTHARLCGTLEGRCEWSYFGLAEDTAPRCCSWSVDL